MKAILIRDNKILPSNGTRNEKLKSGKNVLMKCFFF